MEQSMPNPNFHPLPGANGRGRVCVTEFGAVGEGICDDAPAVQAALDSGATHILIPAGIFNLGNAIRPHSGQSIELQGTLRVADAHVQDLAAPASPGDDAVEVRDASGFRAGQWVVFSADDSPLWQTRRHADCGRIVAVEGRRLRLAGRLTMAYPMAVRPRIGTAHSAVWLDGVSRVRIFGSGTIDGNKANQLDVRPTALDGAGFRSLGSIGGDGGEEIRAACGIAASGPPGTLEALTIEGITVRDASEHNLCLCGLSRGRILNTNCHGCRDKNITLLDCRDCLVEGNFASNSEHEDGIQFHQSTGNERVLVRGNICVGNPRQGIAVGKNERDIHLCGNLCVDNGCNLSLCGIDGSSTGDVARGENYRRFQREARPMGVAIGGLRNCIHNLQVSGGRAILVELMGQDIAWSGGSVRGRRTAADNTGISIGPSQNLEDNPPPLQRVDLRGIAVAGCAAGIRVHGQMEETRIADFRFSDNQRDVVLEPNCGGFIWDKGTAKG